MRISILATHRFHLLDLARELSSLGHDVQFYSYVPTRRCAEFGLSPSLCHCLLWLVWPFFVMQRLAPQRWQESIIWYRNLLMDWYLAKTIRRCDVCIGLGSVYLKAFQTVKRKGAIAILEWGSKHAIEQRRQFGKTDFMDNRVVRRELHGYELCDYIAISSDHVREGFVKQGVPLDKLIVNPYGVNLDDFPPTQCTAEYDLLMVGGWRFEKGCDMIVELLKRRDYRFLHVGSLVNMEFPSSENMTHHEPVDQRELAQYYAKAKVFVLPSRAEGLAMVQAQAIACGLPVVCSKETGGRDLRDQLTDGRWIVEMEDLSLESLDRAVAQALALAQEQQGVRNYAGPSLSSLTWRAYGQRYSTNLEQIAHV